MKRRKRSIYIVVLVIILAAAGGAYYYYTNVYAAPTTQTEAEVQTTRVRRGDLVISATGAGTVIPSIEVDLSFGSEEGTSVSGTLTELNTQLGAQVQVGDILARIDDLAARKTVASAKLQLAKAEQDLEAARQAHEELQEPPSGAEILSARATLAEAQEALEELQQPATQAELAVAEATVASAQAAYTELVNGPDPAEIERAQMRVNQAKNSLWAAQMSRDAKGDERSRASGSYDQAQVSVLNGEISVREAELDLAELREPATAEELKEAQAKLLEAQEQLADLRAGPTAAEIASAEAKVAKAQEALEDLLVGPTEADLAASAEAVRQAELSLAQAQLSLEDAQRELSGTALVSPLAGTVVAVNAEVGERVGSEAIITVADLSHPMLEVYVDETDMDQIAVGYEVEVVLDAIPETTFTGKVTQIDPILVTEMNTQVIRGLVSFDADSFAKPQGLLMGLNATVDIIGGRAENALLVPVESLRELGDGEYAVFVMQEGELKLRTVEVGLMDVTYAEIRAGLGEGDMVSTGLVETR
ncbi:MAG: efflux RND transporter periplasmic adaptor subunit [Anaerolineae bacterium]|nr:efflux RND transporter periplasmic adaptor subunit [Anaerolineae bacterium]